MSSSDRAIYFATGASLVFMVYSVYRHATTLFTADNDAEPQSVLKQVEEGIDLNALAKLARSNSIILQGSSISILFVRAMKENNLRFILDMVEHSPNERIRWKGVTTIQLLTRNDANRTALIDSGALKVLVNVLRDPSNREKSHRYATVSICELISGSVVEYGILEPLARFLVKVNPANELQYWSLMVIQRLATCPVLHPALIEAGMIKSLAEMLRLSFGNASMPKICLQSLVRLIVTLENDEDLRWYLVELLEYDIVPLVTTYTRNGDDYALVYCAIGLIHEYVVRRVAIRQFKDISDLCKTLAAILEADDVSISIVVLRTIKFLMLRDSEYQLNHVIKSGIGLRLAKCLASKDDDVKYWALSITHELVQHPSWRKQFVKTTAFAQVINIGLTTTSNRKPLRVTSEILPAKEYITDILVRMWSSEDDLEMLLGSRGLVEATCVLLQLERMVRDLSTNRVAIVLSEAAKRNEILDRRLTRYGVNLNHPSANGEASTSRSGSGANSGMNSDSSSGNESLPAA
ncbi:hypothetical protein DFQ26_009616 [Actinomortierella ambigua]|nr:hypothetical protein DFQ26_009616 [Actinomortierella ambigua]